MHANVVRKAVANVRQVAGFRHPGTYPKNPTQKNPVGFLGTPT